MAADGDLLGGRYRLERVLALGGMGEVWEARDEVLGRSVAVKVLKPEYAIDPDFVARFRAEARNTARLSHPGIATVYDYGEVAVPGARGDSGYLVMELVPGEPLSAILRERGPLPPSEAMSIAGQTALALQAAHEAGVVHRDVKPGNLMITPDGRVKVTDFGIARATDQVPLTTTGTVLGTSFYLAPEQAMGRSVTAASDVYSLGVVTYECLANRRPFQDSNPVTVALAHQMEPPPPLPPSVPAPIAQLVYEALAKSPDDRPAAAKEFARRALALGDPASTTAMVVPGVAAAGEPALRSTSEVAEQTAAVPRQRRARKVVVLPLAGSLGVVGAVVAGVVLVGSPSSHADNPSPTRHTPRSSAPSSPAASVLPATAPQQPEVGPAGGQSLAASSGPASASPKPSPSAAPSSAAPAVTPAPAGQPSQPAESAPPVTPSAPAGNGGGGNPGTGPAESPGPGSGGGPTSNPGGGSAVANGTAADARA